MGIFLIYNFWSPSPRYATYPNFVKIGWILSEKKFSMDDAWRTLQDRHNQIAICNMRDSSDLKNYKLLCFLKKYSNALHSLLPLHVPTRESNVFSMRKYMYKTIICWKFPYFFRSQLLYSAISTSGNASYHSMAKNLPFDYIPPSWTCQWLKWVSFFFI